MDRKMLAAIVATTLLPLFVNAREGPECPADPYVSDLRNRYKQQLTFRRLLKPIGEPLSEARTDIRCNPLRYVPNEAINIVAAVLYFIVAIILTICESATKPSLMSREL